MTNYLILLYHLLRNICLPSLTFNKEGLGLFFKYFLNFIVHFHSFLILPVKFAAKILKLYLLLVDFVHSRVDTRYLLKYFYILLVKYFFARSLSLFKKSFKNCSQARLNSFTNQLILSSTHFLLFD